VAVIDAKVLRARPLPDHREASGKDDRGRVLIVGGSGETPGGVALAGLAAFRAGAGRVHLATVDRAAAALAVAFPEARVTGLPETPEGAIDAEGAAGLDAVVDPADVVVVGTGALDPDATAALVERVVQRCRDGRTVVLDAAALHALDRRPDLLEALGGRAVLMPNPAEMVSVLGHALELEAVQAEPLAALDAAVGRHGAPVALRDHTTWIGGPTGERFVERTAVEGLGTPGSGDVLAGLIAGLLARGTPPIDALVWAVHAHAAAGARVRGGRLGLLARELLDELADVLGQPARMGQQTSARSSAG
jgi:hydroxyethylthiazole kinase-like uncharacterized protein yjeF